MSKDKKPLRGRPPKYTDDTRVRLSATGRTRLQANSDRRAIVTMLVDRGGTATLREIDEHFGFGIRDRATALIRAGWLEVME